MQLLRKSPSNKINLLQTRPANQCAMKISRLAALKKAGNCQTVYISKLEAGHLSNILDSLKKQAILALADGANMARTSKILHLIT
ncbi:YfiR/HmsC family protein [Nitrosomonas aestuarii]|nr:YfiR/HmsC family protein [Nitrosomonas aestuarii]